MLIEVINYPYNGASPEGTNNLNQHVPELIRLAAHEVGFRNDGKPRQYGIVNNIHDWLVVHPQRMPPDYSGISIEGVRNYYENIHALQALVCKTADAQWDRGSRTIALGGDHSQGFATIKATLLVKVAKALLDGSIPISSEKEENVRGIVRTYANKGEWERLADYINNLAVDRMIDSKDVKKVTDRVAVIWLDAHGDFNSSTTSESHNFHGMSLAAACGEFAGHLQAIGGRDIHLNPKNAWVVGARDLDTKERELMSRKGVHFEEYTMDGVEGEHISTERTRQSGKGRRLSEIINDILDKNPDKEFIVSVDMDHINGDEVPAVSTPMGLSRSTVMERSLEAIQSGDAEHFIRHNEKGVSPHGVDFDQSWEALWGIIHHPKVIAADVTEGAVDIINNPKTSNGQPTLIRTAELLMCMVQKGPYVRPGALNTPRSKEEYDFLAEMYQMGTALWEQAQDLVRNKPGSNHQRILPQTPHHPIRERHRLVL